VRRIITAIIIIIITPALYLAYTFVEQNNFNQNADKFISENFTEKGYVVIYKSISYRPGKNIELAFLTEKFSDAEIQNLENLLNFYDLADANLSIRQNGFSLTEEEWQKVVKEAQSEEEKVQTLEILLEKEREQKQNPEQLLAEAKLINQKIVDISLGELTNGNIESDKNSLIIIVKTDEVWGPISYTESDAIRVWLTTRLNNESPTIYFEPRVINQTEVELES